MDTDSDDVYHSLEQRHLTLLRDHQSLGIDNQSLQGKIAQLQGLVAQLQSSNAELTRDKDIAASDSKQKDFISKELEKTNEELKLRNSHMVDETQRLRDDLKTSTADALTAQDKIYGLMNKCAEAEERILPLQYEITKLSRERELLAEQSAWFEAELANKASEVLRLRTDTSGRISELELRAGDLEGQCASQTDAILSLQERLASRDEKINMYAEKVLALESSAASEQMSFSTELDAQRKLVALYKKYLDEATTSMEELEGSLRSAKEANGVVAQQCTARLKTQQEAFDGLIAQLKEEHARVTADLEAKLAQQTESRRVQVIAGEDADFSAASAREGLLGVSVTDMYNKVVEAQRELNSEKSKRREAELYLNRICKDVESKTPLIIAQQREFGRIVESQAHLVKQLDDAIVETSRLKSSLASETSKSSAAEREASLFKVQNADLAKQVQHLLRRIMEQDYGGQQQRVALIAFEESGSASDVISDRLVTFDDIAEIQSRNMQLLQVVRKLSDEQESTTDGGRLGDAEDMRAALEQAMAELQAMRESRERTEDMMSSLLQQRDMYRVMAEEGGAPLPRLAASPANKDSMAVRESESRLARLEEEHRRAVDRCARLEEAEKITSEALDKARADSLALRLSAAHATSEASFQKERCGKLEEGLQAARSDLEAAVTKRGELQSLILGFQQQARGKDDAILQRDEELRRVNESVRRQQIDLEVTKKSEERLIRQLAELKEDLKRQGDVGDSIRKIEQGLLGQREEELSALAREREGLGRTAEALRKELSDVSVLSEQRQASLEAELKALRSRLDARNEEFAAVREDHIRDHAALVSARERSALLERQLSGAHEQLSKVQGAQVVDMASSFHSAQSELELERALAEVVSLTSELRAAEMHVEQYKKISATNEGLLAEVRQRFTASKSIIEEEVARMSAELEAARRESNERRNDSLQAMQEAESTRTELQQVLKDLAENQRVHNEAMVLAQQEVAALTAQTQSLHEDSARAQSVAKEAQDNYRREVTMHSKTSEELFAVQRQLEESRAEVLRLSRSAADLTAQMLRAEASLEEEKRTHAAAIKETTDKLSDLQSTNSLLHSQMQGLGAQVARFQENREILGSAQTGGDSEELTSLRSAATELREVIRYMKREQDVLQAKTSISENENTRLQIKIASIQKALDTTKAELTKELERRVVSHGEDEFNRLMGEVQQLNILRESNSHLRLENEDITKRLARLTADLNAALDRETPLNDQLRQLSSENAALDAERTALNSEMVYWKGRLQQLVSRYNEVDPEEHRLLQVKLEEHKVALSERDALTETYAKELESTRASLAELEGEMETLKRLKGNEEKLTEKLRTGLRLSSEKAREIQKSLDEYRVEADDLKRQLGEKVAALARETAARAQAQAAKVTAEAAKSAAEAALVDVQNKLTIAAESVPAVAEGAAASARPDVLPEVLSAAHIEVDPATLEAAVETSVVGEVVVKPLVVVSATDAHPANESQEAIAAKQRASAAKLREKLMDEKAKKKKASEEAVVAEDIGEKSTSGGAALDVDMETQTVVEAISVAAGDAPFIADQPLDEVADVVSEQAILETSFPNDLNNESSELRASASPFVPHTTVISVIPTEANADKIQKRQARFAAETKQKAAQEKPLPKKGKAAVAAANKKRKNEEVSKAALESSPTKSVVLDEDANPAKSSKIEAADEAEAVVEDEMSNVPIARTLDSVALEEGEEGEELE